MRQRHERSGPPRAEELAAYVDGTLWPADRQRVEAWLAEHPEVSADLEAQRHCEQLFHASAAPEPAEADWAAVLAGVQRGLRAMKEQRRAAGSLRRALAASAVAAALLLAIGLWLVPLASQSPGPAPFPVVAAGDVEIISVEIADAAALVVGQLPFSGPIVLVSTGDVTLRSVERDPNGDFPDMHMQPEDDDTPMIYAPLVVALKD